MILNALAERLKRRSKGDRCRYTLAHDARQTRHARARP